MIEEMDDVEDGLVNWQKMQILGESKYFLNCDFLLWFLEEANLLYSIQHDRVSKTQPIHFP